MLFLEAFLAKDDVDAFGAESAKLAVQILMAAADPIIKRLFPPLASFRRLGPGDVLGPTVLVVRKLYW